MLRKKIIGATAALVVALAAAPSALASDPYKFSHRAVFEKGAAKAFVALARTSRLGRYRVLSIGCAKGGAGRSYCAVVARAATGVDHFTYSIDCPTDAGGDCTGRIELWP